MRLGSATPFIEPMSRSFEPPEGAAGGETFPDPFFGGEGPERTTCIGCGGCMMGCRHGAKNTLDMNYLYLAEKHGAKVFAETKVVDVRPLDGIADGSNGYEVHTVQIDCAFQSQSPPLHLSRNCFLRVVVGHHGAALPSERQRLAAGDQQSTRPVRAHQFRIVARSARAGLETRPVEGRRDRVRGLHRRAYAHRGGALSRRLRHHEPADDNPDRRTSRAWTRCALAAESQRVLAVTPFADDAVTAAISLGARVRDPALHAGAGGSHRYALGAAPVLAIPQIPGEPGQESAHVYSSSQRIRARNLRSWRVAPL